jgi:cardiolipin synthase A/B
MGLTLAVSIALAPAVQAAPPKSADAGPGLGPRLGAITAPRVGEVTGIARVLSLGSMRHSAGVPGIGSHVESSNEVALIADMGQFLDAVFGDIARARRRVFVESYIIAPGELAEALLTRLEEAARRGLEVKLLCDPSGSNGLEAARQTALRAAGVGVRFYGRAAFLGTLRPGFRDHARLVLADDVAYTGGHAWDDRWLPASRGGGDWHDLNCRLVGPLVAEWASLFALRWGEAQQGWPASFDSGERYPYTRLTSDGPGWRRTIADLQVEAFSRARQRIWLANAYFFPTHRFARALYRASARGVDVRLLVPASSDLTIIRRAARAQYGAWLRHGFRIYEYQGAMMHAKGGLVDDDWITLGSFNALATSLRLTVETNLTSRDPTVARDFDRCFRQRLEASRAVTRASFKRRGPLTAILDGAAWALLSAGNRILHAAG